MIFSSSLSIKQSLNKAFGLIKPKRSATDVFEINLVQVLSNVNKKESEENLKIYVKDLLAEFYYAPDYSEPENNSSPVCYANLNGLREGFSDPILPGPETPVNYSISLANTLPNTAIVVKPELKEAINIIRFCVKLILNTKQENSQSNTTALEKQINEMVYHLYELTPEQIAVVEET